MKRAGHKRMKASSHSRRSVGVARRSRPRTRTLARGSPGAATAVEVTGFVGEGKEKCPPRAGTLCRLSGGAEPRTRRESRLHLAAEGNRWVLGVDFHIGPGDDPSPGDRAGQPDIVGETQ